jgi:hypothetical protein
MSGALDVGVAPAAGASIGIPTRKCTIAATGFNRWLVPPLLCGVWNTLQKVLPMNEMHA